MPLPTILSGNVASALGGAYEVANSCLFDAASGAYMSKSLGTPTNAKKATYSVWIKRCSLGTHSNSSDSGSGQGIVTFKPSNGNFERWNFNGGNKLDFYSEISSSQSYWLHDGPAVYRDVSSWYHVVIAVDSTQSTAANRFKVYVNGTQLTNPTQTSYIAQDTDHVGLASGSTVYVGLGKSHNTNVFYADCYMAEVCFIDGTQYAASDFGEFDSDSPTVWKPKDPSGLTFGNNGFYLDFEDSSNLGNDANGGTDLTEVSIAATDQATDTPTNSFCTMNPLANYYPNNTFAEGNCSVLTVNARYAFATNTIPVSNGKWYWEVKVSGGGTYSLIGISDIQPTATDVEIGTAANSYAMYGAITGGAYGKVRTNDSYVAYAGAGGEYTTNDIIGVYLDLDNNKLYFAKNGTVLNSGTGISITAAASTTEGHYYAGASYWDSYATFLYNFGGCPAFSISSGNADANGYGNFEYDPSSGTFDGSSKDFLAICTKNLGSDGG